MKPSKMSDFTIMRKIGEGSYGKVYKVKTKKDNQVYALKTINISKMDKKTFKTL